MKKPGQFQEEKVEQLKNWKTEKQKNKKIERETQDEESLRIVFFCPNGSKSKIGVRDQSPKIAQGEIALSDRE